jgi:hypothetical protein
MNDNPYYRELVDFRQAFQDWLSGSTPESEGEKTFGRLMAVVPDDLVYIRQDGRLILDTDYLSNTFRAAHGELPGFKMWIEDFRLHWESGDLAFVTFIERDQVGDSEPDGLLSSVLFRKNPDTPFGVEWLTYQETRLPQEEP